ncbi:hypothetical protein QZH41_016604 [Actinostola sp. cb2023]|nr:hypothetical protein QZH41_016604 [Actinostola sp. cb2023]
MAPTPNTTTPTRSAAIKCPMLTYPGYDADDDQYYCVYESWAYGIFAIVGILLIMVPLVALICCIVRLRSRNRKRRMRRLKSTVSSNNYATSSEQPLIPDETSHQNAAYGTIENFSPRRSPMTDSISERRSESHDDVSVVSSKASLMPNYDQASLDLKNSKAANVFSTSYNYPEPSDRSEGLSNAGNPVNPYMSSNVIAANSVPTRNKAKSPIYAVPEEESPKNKEASPPTEQGPVYSVLENPNELSHSRTEMNDSPVDNSNVVVSADCTKKPNVEVLDDDSANLLDTETPSSEPLYNILEPTKTNISTKTDSTKEDNQHPSSQNHVYQSLLDNKDHNSGDNSKCNEGSESPKEPRYMPVVFPKKRDNSSNGDENKSDMQAVMDSNPTLPPRSKDRSKSRADYQEILLDAIQSYPIDERNGCFVLRDSISSPGSKALTVYNKNTDSQQEFYNFKVY